MSGLDEDHPITAAGLQALEAELAELEGPRRRELAGRIKTAREWGDLKENAEYHDAKNEQAHLETRIKRLRERILSSVVVRAGEGTPGTVSFGSTVVLSGEDGTEQTWTIVSSHEASPREGRLSVDSPVAAAVMGHRVGEEIAVALPRGERRFRICGVS